MPAYCLTFDRLAGEEALTRQVAGDGPAELAQETHRHARGILRSNRLQVTVDAEALVGTVLDRGRLVGTFTLTAEPETTATAPVGEVLHGYGLDDLHQLALHVVRSDRWTRGTDTEDRYDAAWHAMVEHLLTVEEAPSRRDLFLAGRAGCDRVARQDMQARGYNTSQYGTGSRPNFERYWLWESAPTHSPEGGIVDREALWQIWPKLTRRQQEALTALAATGDYRQAAAHLGVTQGTFHVLVSTARRRFLTWWHEGEAPSRIWGTDRRVGSRSAAAPPTSKRRPATRAVTRRAASTGRPVHELVHGKASTYTNHDCRCPQCTQAATDQARERSRRGGAVARRRVTVSQLPGIRARHQAGETLTAIAADMGFSGTYLSRLLSGARKPAPDPA